MKRNSSIQVLIILMLVMFFVTGLVAAAGPVGGASSAPKIVTSAPKTTASPKVETSAPKATPSMVTVLSVDEAMRNVGPDDSALVISGKVDMGGADYHSVLPNFYYDYAYPGPVSYYNIKQYKSNAAAGYKRIIVFKDTNKNPEQWKYFLAFNQYIIKKSATILVWKTEESHSEYWEITAPSLPKTYPVGLVQPK